MGKQENQPGTSKDTQALLEMARALGTTGYLTALRRTSIGELSVVGAVSGDDLAQDADISDEAWLEPADAMAGMERIEIDAGAAAQLRMGQRVDWAGARDVDPALITEASRLVAIGRVQAGRLYPSKVFPA